MSAGAAQAQWTITSPGLIPSIRAEGGGAIVEKQGIVWAAMREIYLSKDDGLSWQRRNTPLSATDVVKHLDFFDDSVGLLAAGLGEVFITFDQAVTWKRLVNAGSAWSARFIGSPLNIVIARASYGAVDVTTDGGASWSTRTLGSNVPFVVPLTGGSAYALVGTSRLGAQIFLTTDYGATWAPSPDSVGYDTYSFGVDPCSPERIYVANEDGGGSPNNGLSEIFTSSNGGVNWKVTYSGPVRDVAGSISVASNAIYAQRGSSGVLRSIDFGNTWQDVGGPPANFDTRLICAVTDNLVIAADAQGNIWRTINGGGDSVHGVVRLRSITSFPDMMFVGDTLLSCDPPTYDTLLINSIFCVAPRIVSVVIEGDHPNDFILTSLVPKILTGADTLTFEFHPRGNGERRANLRITLEDSSTIVVPMRGFGKGVTELTLSTFDVATDTLGAIVYIPLTFSSLGEMTGVSMQMHYESDQIEFVDAYDLLGVSVVAPLNAIKRHQLIFATPIQQNGLIGHAAFRVYSGEDACLPVGFDSIKVITNSPACAFAINPEMQALICVPVDCVAQRVSDYLRYGKLPELNVTQQRDDLLIATDVNFGDVKIRVLNALGCVELSHASELRGDLPIRFSIASLPSGLYFIEVQSALGQRIVKQVVQR